jgi:hypothetical protein
VFVVPEEEALPPAAAYPPLTAVNPEAVALILASPDQFPVNPVAAGPWPLSAAAEYPLN